MFHKKRPGVLRRAARSQNYREYTTLRPECKTLRNAANREWPLSVLITAVIGNPSTGSELPGRATRRELTWPVQLNHRTVID